MAIYLATRTDRYYDHFVRQAVAFLEGHAAIRYPVEASGSLHRNAYFQDVLSIATTDGVLSYQRLDEALETMAEFADIKHSTKTAELAAAASQSACFPEPDVVTLRSAGLVHDLGRVGSRTGSGRGGGRSARPSGNAFVCMHT
jgi:HD-GYP domain-containing protein (c-di-GMP phosphodiesterase class II)